MGKGKTAEEPPEVSCFCGREEEEDLERGGAKIGEGRTGLLDDKEAGSFIDAGETEREEEVREKEGDWRARTAPADVDRLRRAGEREPALRARTVRKYAFAPWLFPLLDCGRDAALRERPGTYRFARAYGSFGGAVCGRPCAR